VIYLLQIGGEDPQKRKKVGGKMTVKESEEMTERFLNVPAAERQIIENCKEGLKIMNERGNK